jgi:predicted nucleic acid-binding protein
MNTQFVDTSIFLRHLTGDDPKKAQACFQLFQEAEENKVSLFTSQAIIAEMVYILSSSTEIYKLSQEEIRARLYPLLLMPGLKLTHRKTYLRALDLYATHSLDFEDALTVAHMERRKIKEVFTYARGFDRIPTIKRLEP